VGHEVRVKTFLIVWVSNRGDHSASGLWDLNKF
jgi:hypothetical protein